MGAPFSPSPFVSLLPTSWQASHLEVSQRSAFGAEFWGRGCDKAEISEEKRLAATKQKSVKRSAFSLNWVQALSE